MRQIKYVDAISEAFNQIMETDKRVFVMGVGVNSPWYVGKSMVGLYERFGDKRVIDPPVSENGFTGIAVGAALKGLRPIVVHPRMDFMYLAFDQIINHAAHWHYMLGGSVSAPITIRGIINRGGEQSVQHSQSLHSMLAHVPGLKVVMPATPYDAKGLLMASVQDENPVIYIDDRWLYDIVGKVPEESYIVPIGKGVVCKEGKDITIVSISYMVVEALKAANLLEQEGINAEVIDLRSVKPFDKELLLSSVKKTGHVVITDVGWKTFGFSAEIAAFILEEAFQYLKAAPIRLALPDVPAPASRVLEELYYPKSKEIMESVKQVLGKEPLCSLLINNKE